MEVIDIVKSKLSPVPADDILTSAIEEVGQTIMTFCNREDIPAELRFVHANMVVDFINGATQRTDPDSRLSAKSIKEGDVTVEFGGSIASVGEQVTEKLLFEYSSQLMKFRKLRWSRA